jgi:hypothetical protein
MGSIALALVDRKPTATHLVREEMGQEVIRVAAVVAIGAGPVADMLNQILWPGPVVALVTTILHTLQPQH